MKNLTQILAEFDKRFGKEQIKKHGEFGWTMQDSKGLVEVKEFIRQSITELAESCPNSDYHYHLTNWKKEVLK